MLLCCTLPPHTQAWFSATYGTSVDVHASITEDEHVAAMHANAEVFDSSAEHVFTYLQVREKKTEKTEKKKHVWQHF